MGLKKKTIKLVTKVLSDAKKRKLYSPGEILYMEKQVERLKRERAIRLERRRRERGFSSEDNKINYDD